MLAEATTSRPTRWNNDRVQSTGPGTPHVAFFGAPLDSGNRGVEALGRSTLGAVFGASPSAAVTLFDNGWGVRPLRDGSPHADQVELCGVRNSRRVHRPESWARVSVSQRLGLPNPVADRLRRADLVLDVSGGDSFSDVYGARRLQTVLAPKRAALRAGRPLVLLPQTYGPYRAPEARSAAASVVRRAAMVWSRDQDSHEVLLGLLGADVDPARHRLGVDMAFGLTADDPGEALPDAVRTVLEDEAAPVVGVNVSGLLVNDPSAHERFGLALDYMQVVTGLVERLVADGSRVLLVPHVRDRAGGGESDHAAAGRVLAALSPAAAAGVRTVPDSLDARQVKWVVARCDWFCGARMHATVAALSTGVPASAVAYSMKFRGVFATCGMEEHVVEARSTTTAEAVERLVQAYTDRNITRQLLARTHPVVVDQARRQLAEAIDMVAGRAAA